eukprot:CAMPEP_0195033628 /NCGR_PEP_ID=MMETSP0326_2-20130528/66012_1 /TAXON_ID=2866 ORGANISM="Crypthecodinium cohnii, Strain Seligo" /NCGR_SAMPLE_ID=MMETSP0326_2 /ASSEMBLY_ACC=CAM_ASM_000348 /LENGTH=30 /DNA_ID= /DNA_START= /DNA_END= /DNA_ORIENTATION=
MASIGMPIFRGDICGVAVLFGPMTFFTVIM